MMYVQTGNKKYEIRVLSLGILPPGQPIYSACATRVEVTDEAGGEFIELIQQTGAIEGKESISIAPAEWPVLRDAIDFMVSNLRDENEPDQRGTEPAELPAEADHSPVAVPIMPF